ncbi:sarcosine oxidase subunit gamma [Nesterenkonia suensis]
MADLLLTHGPTELRRSPLEHLQPRLEEASASDASTIRLAERPFTTQVGLRAVPGTAAHRALGAALGVGLPERVGEVAGDADDVAVLWLGPDEFLVVAPPDGSELIVRLQDALAEEPGQVVDLSANRTVVEIAGTAARDVLEKGSPVDLHPRMFPTGAAVTTTLGPTAVLLWRTGEETWWILPRASFAEYTAWWLLDATREHRALTPDASITLTDDEDEEAAWQTTEA